jgi:hypothetical protein
MRRILRRLLGAPSLVEDYCNHSGRRMKGGTYGVRISIPE